MTQLNHPSMTRLVTLHNEDSNRDGMTPVFLLTNAGGLTRSEQWDGRDFFVVQTVAAISKVMNGELLPASELSLFTESWNGRPVPLRHPQVNGLHVSANDPAVLSDYNLGYFFNAHAEEHELGVKLVGEMWLDVDRIKGMGGPALNALEILDNGGTVEVSTAYFCMVKDQSGEYGGEPYTGVQHNIKPDHVALLPDQEGACSIEDGCGINTNAMPTSGQDARDGAEGDQVVSNALEPGQSAMVGVWLSQASSSILRFEADGVEPVDDLHVTLAYLGEGDQVVMDQQSLAALVDYAARFLYPHTVKIGGSFRFYSDDLTKPDPVGYLVEGDTLNAVRSALVSELSWEGQTVARADQWVPHVTLGYTSEQDVQVPVPGVNRFSVNALTLAYGGETITFPLRGELGLNYSPRHNSGKDSDMSEQQNDPRSQDVQVNQDATDNAEETVGTPASEIVVEVPEELKQFMNDVEAAGGVRAIMDALQTVTAANAAKKAGAIERIKSITANYSDDVLEAMDAEALVTLADTLDSVRNPAAPSANYAASGGNAHTEPVVYADGFRPFDFED